MRPAHDRVDRRALDGGPTARPDRAGDQVRRADGSLAERARRLAATHPLGRGRVAASAGHGLHRPLPAAQPRSRYADRGDDAGAGRPRALGQGALRGLFQLPRLAAGSGAGRIRQGGDLPASTATSRATTSSGATSSPTCSRSAATRESGSSPTTRSPVAS